jgi:predicted DCC family thiol-disulfide oxidoreductase YuxK
VRFVLAEDRLERPFTFAALQEAAAQIAGGASLPDSIAVKTEDGEVLFKSRAVCYMMMRLGGYWRVLATVLRIVPRVLSDGAYDFVARVRYRVFGRAEKLCPILPKDLRARFVSEESAALPVEG